jgi:hypothetical protein
LYFFCAGSGDPAQRATKLVDTDDEDEEEGEATAEAVEATPEA